MTSENALKSFLRPSGHHVLGAAAIVLLAAAAWFRLGNLDLMLFHFDEGIASIYAVQLVHRGIIPLYGVKTSLNFYNPPLFIYLIALPYAVSWSPAAATGYLQLFYLAALAWLWRTMRRAGWSVAALAILLIAGLSPGPLLLGQRLWGHAVIAPLSVATLLLVWRMRSHPHDRMAAILLPLAVSAAQQVHFSGILLAIDAALGLWLVRAHVNWRWLAAGVAIAFATYTPYVIHLFQTDFADVRTILSLIVHGAGGSANRATLWIAAFHSLSDFGGNDACRQNYARFVDGVPGLAVFRWATAIMLAAACCTAAAAWIRRLWWRRRYENEDPYGQLDGGIVLARLGLLWMGVPLLVFSVLRVETVPAYWLIALPGPWLVTGAMVELLAAKIPRGRQSLPCRIAAGSILLLLAAYYFACLKHYDLVMTRSDDKVIVLPPYRDERNAIRYICDASRGQRALISQDARGPEAGLGYQYIYLIAMMEGNAERFSPDNPATATSHFLIHNRAVPLPADLHAQLGEWQARRFGLLDVFRTSSAEQSP